MPKALVVQPFFVGQRIGRLRLTSLVPFTQRCFCGELCSWTRTAILTNGVRSCGCGRGVPVIKEGDEYSIFRVEKTYPNRADVLCKLCGAAHTMSNKGLRYSRALHCRDCP